MQFRVISWRWKRNVDAPLFIEIIDALQTDKMMILSILLSWANLLQLFR